MPLQPAGAPPRGGPPTLRQVRKEFPQFAISREITLDRARYVARSRYRRLNPHTVVTADLAELRDALAGEPPSQHLTPGDQCSQGGIGPPNTPAPGTPTNSPAGAR